MQLDEFEYYFAATFSMVHLLHRLYGVDAPANWRGIASRTEVENTLGMAACAAAV